MWLNADPARLAQIFSNLLNNAAKYTRAGGQIRFCALRDGENVVISVKDTGVGIPGDKLEAIFERFWQASVNDTRGLGLGLYISKCLVEAHGGKIWAESRLGVGSTLFFTIPAAR